MLKHRSGNLNKVVDALSRRNLLTNVRVEVLLFDELKNLYEDDPNFAKKMKACREPIVVDQRKWLNYFIQEGILFSGS